MANIQFNNVKEILLPFGGFPIGIEGLTEDLIAENGGIINATQIDWNGAQLGDKTLNTTGDVLSLISDNNTNIETLKQHSHANYATQSYVTNKIKEASISGGSGLDVEEYIGTENYNLLVAPEGSKYTEIGSLNDGGTWSSQLYATVDNNNHGDTTLYSTYFDGTFIGKFAHSHANYATQSYVKEEINKASISGGGSGLDIEEYTDTVNYNLLVAPEGSKYTELGSLSDGGTWSSQLYATVDNNNNGDTTLFSTYFDGTFIGTFAHSHANYVTVTSFNSRIKNLESRIEYLESYLSYIFDEGTDVPSTPTKPTDIKVNVIGGLYGTGEETTLDEIFYMTSYEGEISEDNLKFTLTAVPSNANATFAIKYVKNSDGDVQDPFVNVTTSTITNGLIVNVTPKDIWDDMDWTEYEITATNENGNTGGTLRIEFSYLGDESEVPEIPSLTQKYFYVGQTQPTASNYTTLATQVTSYPTKYEYTPSSRAYTYVLVANNKTVTKIEDANLGSSISFTLDDTIKITGYSVYKSLVKISGKVYIHIS